MDSFFGIGIMELAFIAILALIVLGPERLPSAARETAKFFGQLRALSSEFTSQFSEELQMLDEINPKKLADEITREAMNPAKKSAGAATAKKSAQPAAKPLAPSTAASGKSSESAKKTATTDAATNAATDAVTGGAASEFSTEQMAENTILPPEGHPSEVSEYNAREHDISASSGTNGTSPSSPGDSSADASTNSPAAETPPASAENGASTERAA